MTGLTPLLAPAADADHCGLQQRTDARSNMFVMAAIYCPGGTLPVRIRNMSRSGALIESATIPPGNSKVRLCRGGLSVSGLIIWQRGNRAGIRFDSDVAVADWLPRGSGLSGQHRVDEIVHACKTLSSAGLASLAQPATTEPNHRDFARQMLQFRDALSAIAEELAGDMAIAAAHPTALRALDVMGQKFEKLACALAGKS